MLPQLFTLLACSVLQITASPCKSQNTLKTTTIDKCPSLRIFATRGTLEEAGAGAMEPLVDRLLKDIPNSDNISTVYPAGGITVDPDGTPHYNAFAYSASVSAGRAQLRSNLLELFIDCPDTDIVLMGYSQGAHVTGDIICGSTFPFFQPAVPIRDAVKAKIKAVITLGDPRNNKDKPTHVGTSDKGGLFPRTTFGYCGNNVVSKWRTYCDDNDVFCDHGKSIDAHLHYVSDYFDDIIKHIEDSVKSTRFDL